MEEELFFKDSFTKTEDGINLSVNNIEIDCLTSKSNKFNLDSDGNLTVNSISFNDNDNQISNQEICNLIYPIGSLYLSINSTNPSTLFGGMM